MYSHIYHHLVHIKHDSQSTTSVFRERYCSIMGIATIKDSTLQSATYTSELLQPTSTHDMTWYILLRMNAYQTSVPFSFSLAYWPCLDGDHQRKDLHKNHTCCLRLSMRWRVGEPSSFFVVNLKNKWHSTPHSVYNMISLYFVSYILGRYLLSLSLIYYFRCYTKIWRVSCCEIQNRLSIVCIMRIWPTLAYLL